MARKVQTTVRIPEDTHNRFKELVAKQDRDMNEVYQELMARWLDEQSADTRGERARTDLAVNLLIEAVCAQLKSGRQWATEALIRAGMGLPGSNVFDRRIAHFPDEKQELGRRFAHWIVRRSAHYIHQGSRVVLLCDSGTTVFWFLKELGEAIEQSFPKEQRERLRSLKVVTNNIPGAESFVTYASHREIAPPPATDRLSDLVECRLLAGTFLPEYVAITGPDTVRDLDAYAAQVRGGGKRGEKATPVFIGVTTGNWITLRKSETYPTFLARGRGHREFKEKLLDVADEIFCIAPLGKILIGTEAAELNKMLNYSTHATNPQLKAYESVQTPPSKRHALKIVSTIRDGASVLRDHSVRLRFQLGDHATLHQPEAAPTAGNEGNPALPIKQLKHLLFAFDRFANKDPDMQLDIELPHDLTRNKDFMARVFSIRSAARGV